MMLYLQYIATTHNLQGTFIQPHLCFINSTCREYDSPAAQLHTQKAVTIIRSIAPINLVVYYPKNEEGQLSLAKRVSDVHAAAVTQRIKSLNCSKAQKLELLDAVIDTVKERSREQT